MSLIDDLNHSDLYTKSELPVIEYINSHYNEVCKMSINELARATYSSNASLIRICKKLGYKGYKDFKIALAIVIESNKYIHKDIDYTYPFKGNESTTNIINSISNLYKNTIDLINSHLDIIELDKIVDVLNNSKNVYVFSNGDTNITAQSFINKLVKIGQFYYNASDKREDIQYARYSTQDDCCLFITYDSINDYMSSIQEAIKNNAKIIIISANNDHPIIKYCDYHIFIPHQEEKEKIATFYSQHAFNYILNIIYSLLYKKADKTHKKT